MKKTSTSLTLYPKRLTTIIYLFISLLFTFVSISMITDKEPIGWAILIFSSFGFIVFTVKLLPNSSYLHISEKGFTICSLFRKSFTNWGKIDQFGVGYVGGNKSVVMLFDPKYKKLETTRKILRNLAGAEGSLPDTYGKSAEELASLLNAWKERFSTEKY